ncbi:Ras association domain-containing protein 10 [Manis javanica]|nr:Ras association domain-containing protein 10 [Manis javanica]
MKGMKKGENERGREGEEEKDGSPSGRLLGESQEFLRILKVVKERALNMNFGIKKGLVESIMFSHCPTWDDCQQLLRTLFTTEE